MQHLAISAPPASTLPEQSITGFAHAEVMFDSDTGQSTFCVALEQNLSDFQASPIARGVAAAQKLREKADEIEALANQYAATVVIPEFIKHYGIELEEHNLTALAEDAPELAAGFSALGLQEGGVLTVIVPKGQLPVERLDAIRSLILHWQRKADAA